MTTWVRNNATWRPLYLRITAAMLLALLGLGASAHAQVVTGQYAGTGLDDKAITQLGFQPAVVIVKGNTAQPAVIRTSTMTDDSSKKMLGGDPLSANRIQSFETVNGGGFTVGNDAAVNSLGVDYFFTAFNAVAGTLSVGSYVGDGSPGRLINDVGFSPELVFVMSAEGHEAIFRISSAVTSFNFDNGVLTDILALAGNGFVVNGDSRVNQSGTTYHYVAWNEVAGEMDVGSYPGNGADNRNLTGVGFQPEYILLRATSGLRTLHRPASLGIIPLDETLYYIDVTSSTNRIQALQADGFQMGDDDEVNKTTLTYVYAAWKRVNLTAVKLASVEATRYPKGTLLEWRTGHEVDNLGFHVYREVQGTRTRITSGLIGGSGLVVGQHGATNAGHAYRWWDREGSDIDGPVTYWLEDVDLNGVVSLHGPIVPRVGKSPKSEQAQSELLKRLSQGRRPERRQSMDETRTGARGRLPILLSNPIPEEGSEPGPAGLASDDADARKSTGPRRRRHDRALVVQQALAAERSIKISVRAEGWYRVTQPQLVAAGLPTDVDPHTLQLFVDGVEQPIKVLGEADGRFNSEDVVEFYGTGLDTPYTDARVYWLIGGRGAGQRIPIANGRGRGAANAKSGLYQLNREHRVGWPRTGRPTRRAGACPVDTAFGAEDGWGCPRTGPEAALPIQLKHGTSDTSFPFTVERKDRTIFFAALQNGEAENFFGDLVMTEPIALTLSLTHVDPAPPGFAPLEVVLQGVTDTPEVRPDHQVRVVVNGAEVGSVIFDGRESAAETFPVTGSLLREGDNVVTLVARGGDADISLVDVIRLTYWHTYAADADRLRFTGEGQQSITITGFSNAAIQVFDITEPGAVVEVLGNSTSDGSISLVVPGTGARTLLALTGSRADSPSAVQPNIPSAWHRAAHSAQYVIVSHGDFLDSLAPLRALHEAEGLRVAVVDVEDIYDEFSFGAKSPYAIRDFLVRAGDAWRTPLRFVTLVGNATTDPRDYLGRGEPDYLPTKLVPTAVLETASDDWFVDGDEDGTPELAAIGRLPARTPEQAAAMVAKIVAYAHAPTGTWTRDISVVADAGDAGDLDFAAAARRLLPLIPRDYEVREIYRGELGTGAARTALLNSLNGGQALVNYIGHGSVQLWRDDLFTSDDVPGLANGERLPFFVMMNCLNGFFHGLFPEESLAESLMRAHNGGAIAVWASSGVTGPISHGALNRALLQLLFDGQGRTLGEAVAAAKSQVGDLDVQRSWIFFGDPATRLSGAPQIGKPRRR